MINKNLLPVKIPRSGPHESDSHPRNETQIFSVFPLAKKKAVESSRPFRLAEVWPVGGWGQASLSTGRHGCANKCAGYLSSLVLYGDKAEALGFSSDTNMGAGPTSRALLLGVHSPDELI